MNQQLTIDITYYPILFNMNHHRVNLNLNIETDDINAKSTGKIVESTLSKKNLLVTLNS